VFLPAGRQRLFLRLVACPLLAVALLWPTARPAALEAQGQTGVSGVVQIIARSSRRLASAGAYPGRTVLLSSEYDQSELASVVVFARARTTSAAPRRAAIRQVNEEFLPRVVAVTVGSVVEFPNEDLLFHNVFSLSRAATFDLGRYPRGEARSRRFDRPGLVKVYCHLHSHMSALVRVFDHPWFTIPNQDGHFTLVDLPPGRHDIVAWHERVGEVTLPAEVEAGRLSRLSFSLPLTDEP
jgi:plastocyanin